MPVPPPDAVDQQLRGTPDAPHRHDTPLSPLPAVSEYRHDLDGLRGIAIALVVVFHIWMGRVSGGVDVFLVLSGFFFTGMVLRRTDIGGVDGWQVVRRTARRLLPALVVVLATVAVATVILRPYTQWADIADQTLAAAFYYQNWHLAYAELDYLAPDPSVSPLQHLWSMAVQGQFYLAMLVLLAIAAWISQRIGRRALHRPGLVAVLAGLTAVSFWYAADGTGEHQTWTYYDSFARAWELLIGAALAVAAPWIAVAKPLRTVLAILGLTGVLTCGLLIDGATRFPGPAALYPVAAAVALIVAGMNTPVPQRPWANRLLATRVFTELGALGYALYLWHWPVLIFYLAEYGKPTPGIGGGLLVLGVSLALALITQRFIETPLRRRSTSTPVPTPLPHRGATGVVVMLGVGVLVSALGWQAVLKVGPPQHPQGLDPVRYPGAAALVDQAFTPSAPMRPTVLEGPTDSPPPTTDGCITPNREIRTCTYGDPTAPHAIALVGGSHSEHWIPAFELLAREHNFRIVTFLKEGCPLTLVEQPSYAETPFPECSEWSVQVLDRLTESRPDWVFTIATRNRVHDDGDEVPPEYLDIWTALSDRGLNVLALRDTPRLRRDGVLYRAVDCLAQRGSPESCGIDRATALDPHNPAEQPATVYPNVFPLDLSDAVCRPDRCRVAEGNVLIYRDEHHLTASYARTLAPELGRQIGALTPWW